MPLHGGIGVHLTKQQSDPQADGMSCWPTAVPLLTTWWLYWRWGWGGALGAGMGCRGCQGASKGCRGVRWTLGVTYEIWRWSIAKYSWKLNSLLQTIEHELRSTGPKLVPVLAQFSCIYISTILPHQMALLGGTSELRSVVSTIIPFLAQQMSSWPDAVPLFITICH